jgi:hypothetical protein
MGVTVSDPKFFHTKKLITKTKTKLVGLLQIHKLECIMQFWRQSLVAAVFFVPKQPLITEQDSIILCYCIPSCIYIS